MKKSNKFLTISLLSILILILLFALVLHIRTENNLILSKNIIFSTTQKFDNTSTSPTNFVFKDFNCIQTSGNWQVVIKKGDQYQIKVLVSQETSKGINISCLSNGC